MLHFFQPEGNAQRTSANVIVLRDNDGLIMFDVGGGLQRDIEALIAKMRCADLDPGDLHTILLTHAHFDHVGAIRQFCAMAKRPDVRVLLHESEKEIALNTRLQHASLDLGLIKKHLDASAAAQTQGLGSVIKVIERMLPSTGLPDTAKIRTIREGEALKLGRYHFRIMATPGHSPGHLAFYEVNRKMLLAGDLFGEASAIWYAPSCGGVSEFNRSLARIGELDVKTVFPSHGDVFCNLKERISSVRSIIAQRDAIILDALDQGPCTVWELARKMFDTRVQQVFPGIMLVETHLARLAQEGRFLLGEKRARSALTPARVSG